MTHGNQRIIAESIVKKFPKIPPFVETSSKAAEPVFVLAVQSVHRTLHRFVQVTVLVTWQVASGSRTTQQVLCP